MAYDLSSPAVGRVPGHDKENPSPPLIQKGGIPCLPTRHWERCERPQTTWREIAVNERDDNFPRSKRTTEAYLSVFKPLIWNVPLVIAFVVFALTTRPSFGDAVPVFILTALFVAMCIPVAIAAS